MSKADQSRKRTLMEKCKIILISFIGGFLSAYAAAMGSLLGRWRFSWERLFMQHNFFLALGCGASAVCIELLVGEPPFVRKKTKEIIQRAVFIFWITGAVVLNGR